MKQETKVNEFGWKTRFIYRKSMKDLTIENINVKYENKAFEREVLLYKDDIIKLRNFLNKLELK